MQHTQALTLLITEKITVYDSNSIVHFYDAARNSDLNLSLNELYIKDHRRYAYCAEIEIGVTAEMVEARA